MDNQDTKAIKAIEIEAKGPEVMVLNFADSKIPEFKEVRNKDYILYGLDNLYPEYLTYLYNKSAKHSAIINGKSKYIHGGGFVSKSNTDPEGRLPAINRNGETWNDVSKRTIKDVEVYGGYRLIIIWDILGRMPSDIFHIEWRKLRTAKDGGFFYKEDWTNSREQAIYYPEFNIDNRKGCQIYAYNEYRPGAGVYPLPEFLACNNYIETDIEISKYNLSCIRNGMMPSKMIQFFSGDPTNEKKGEVEKQWKKKFAGAENGGRFILAFSPSKEKSVEITDLSATESDKLFTQLNLTCQQEIFTGHQVVSPMLFGIKTEGQLGGTGELKNGYEIFINTYAKPKQQDIEKTVNYFNSLLGRPADYYIEQLDPVGLQIDASAILDKLPLQFIYEKLNIPKEYWNLPAANPTTQTGTTVGVQEQAVNDNIKNLTAKQHQQLMRLIRQYSKGQLTRPAVCTLLKSGLGLSDEDINSLLGDEEQFSATELDEDGIIQLFDQCGELKNGYTLVKSKAVKFSSDDDAMDDELNQYQAFYKPSGSVSVTEGSILNLINKDSKITPELIAEALGTTADYVTVKIASLINKGYLETTIETIGEDEQIERKLTKPITDIKTIQGEPDQVEIFIKYSYEGPVDSRNRPFCKKMVSLNRYYSRFEIEQISQRLGYSVFDRRGGFWKHKDGVTTPYCRHKWAQNIIVKKG